MPKTSKNPKKPAKKPQRKKTINIKLDPETHRRLEKLKIIPQEPFDSVVRRLLDFYEQHQAEKKPQTTTKEDSSRETGFIA